MAITFLEKPKVILANPALVKEFVEMTPAPHDRPLSQRRLTVYNRIYADGLFRSVTWACVTCAEVNETYRINGKHTSVMLGGRTAPYDPPMYVTVERYVCDRLSEVATLYNSFDSGLASRSIKDINLAFAATIPELTDVPDNIVNLTVGAIAMNKWEDNELKKVPPAERAEQLLDNVDFAKWLHERLPGGQVHSKTSLLGEGADSRPLRRIPVAAAMYGTFRKLPKVATQFWELVRSGNGQPDCPTRLLNKFLNRAVTIGGGNTRGTDGKKGVSQRQLYVVSLNAWNAYRKNEPTTLKYSPKWPIPKIAS